MFKLFKNKKTIQLPIVEKLSKNYDVVIHIGAPKAGSSAIQKYLLENRNKLLEIGFYYPEHGLDENGISGGHSNLGKNLKDGDFETAKAIMQTHLNEAKKRNSTLLISAESLFNRANQLKQMTDGYRCKIIAFLRDPLDSLYSNYNQGIKRNYLTTRLELHCKNQLKMPNDSLSGKIFDQWADAFGKENLIVLDYDLDLFAQIPIQSVFLSIIGIDSHVQKQSFTIESQFVNNSYTLAALELKRLFNFVLDQEKVKLNNEIDWFLQGISDKNSAIKFQLIERISDKTYQQLKEKFTSSNSKIRDEYLLKLNPNFIKESQQPKLKTINQHQLNLEMADILTQLETQKLRVYRYIQQRIEWSLENRTKCYELNKLAEMFNFDINQLDDLENKDKWFSENKLKNMPNMQLVEIYRDIAHLCYQRGDLANAQILIEKAREIRPKGPTIIKLSEQIKQALNNK